MRRSNKGSGMLEAVFMIGVLGLVLTGVVALMTKTMAVRNRSFEKKKAAELAAVIMEEMYAQQENHPDTFWTTTNWNRTNQENSNYPDYSYDIEYTHTNEGGKGNCAIDGNCARLKVTVKFKSDQSNNFVIEKFLSR